MESVAINTAELLQVALESAGLGSWELYLSTGAVHRTVRHDQIFGYSEIQPFWDLDMTLEHIADEDRAAVRLAFSQAKLSGNIDVEARTRQGAETRWVHLRGRTFYVDDAPTRIVGVIADATLRRAVEDRLRQAQQIEALGQLTSGVAHDFNNLLQVICSGLQVLDRQTDPARRERTFTAMKQAVDRGAGLCRRLLAFSRRQALKPEAVNLERLEVDPRDLELVMLDPALNIPDPMPPAADDRPANAAQVLVVEDDDEVAELTVEMINQLGYNTMRVASAEAALGALADRRPVDIVFSDVMMPGLMNGVELSQEIRRRRPSLPVLLTSGYAEAALRKAGAQQIKIIPKPYKIDELRDALAAVRQDTRKSIREH